MIDYPCYQQIRRLRDQEHLSCAQIARHLGLHPQTVAKWAARSGYQRRGPARRASKLDPFRTLTLAARFGARGTPCNRSPRCQEAFDTVLVVVGGPERSYA